MRSLISMILLITATAAFPGVYKWVGPDGSVHYSDKPVEQARELHLLGVGKPIEAESAKGEAADLGESGYEALEIVQPEPDQTVRTDSGEVSVGILVEPGLQPGHSVRLTVDGNVHKETFTSTQLMLSQVGRGSHSISVSILDAEGNVLASSASVSFHVRRALAEPAE